jgi:hypothetical protein
MAIELERLETDHTKWKNAYNTLAIKALELAGILNLGPDA